MSKLTVKHVLKEHSTKIKVEFDKTNKIRPSWIRLKKSNNKIRGLHIKYGKWRWLYFKYLADYFLPSNYNKEDMQKLYDHWSHEYDKGIRAVKHNEKAMRFTINLLLKHCKPSNQKILDVGCGTGLAAGVFLKNGFKDIGNDRCRLRTDCLCHRTQSIFDNGDKIDIGQLGIAVKFAFDDIQKGCYGRE